MKLKNAIILILFAIALSALAVFAAGCSSGSLNLNEDEWDGAVVTFSLEGGTYKNSTNDVKFYFNLKEGETVKIGSPEDYSEKEVLRAKYKLNGWCRSKTGEGTGATYSDPWDFESDVLKYGDRITLYANWLPLVNHTYNVCYKDETTGETVVLGTYNNQGGLRFNDYSHYGNNRSGYTVLPGYYDEQGNPWDSEFVHPGGEEAVAVNVYVKFIEGDFKLVSTPDELNSVTGENVFLLNDIDFEGATLTSLNNFAGIFEGDNHTVKNFNINRGSAFDGSYARDDLLNDDDLGGNFVLGISIFGRMNGGQVSNVNFENVSVDIRASYSGIARIIVAPIAVKLERSAGGVFTEARDSKISNVTFDGTYTVSALPGGFDEAEDLIIVTGSAYYFKSANNAAGADNVQITFAAAQTQTSNIDLYYKRKDEIL